MESEIGSRAGSGTLLLAAAAFLGAMIATGLMAAFYRINGLYRNGLLEAGTIGKILHEYLRSSRRFMVTVHSLYLAATMLSCFAWGRLLANVWVGPLTFRFYLVLAVVFILVWSLGGLVFKQLATRTALGFAKGVGVFFFPFFWIMRPWTAVILWLMEKGDSSYWSDALLPQLSQDEIRSLLQEEDGKVVLEDDEREMINSIFGFHDTAVREIMIPRIDMFALDAKSPIRDIVPQVNDSHHSRIPIFDGSVDKVTGILYAKDLLALFQEGRFISEDKVVGDLARPAYYIPESKKIDEVLAEFRAKRIHMAIVIDEYGGTAGIVTFEDILEEIVGDIEDEFDQAEQLFEWVDEQCLRVDPKIDLEDLQELVGIRLPTEGSETLGGLIYEVAGKVPEVGDQIIVAGLAVTVEKVEDQRLLQVVITGQEPMRGYAKSNGEKEQ
jgi:putative hemolysin